MSLHSYNKLLTKIGKGIYNDNQFIMFKLSEKDFCELLPSMLDNYSPSKRHNANIWPGETLAKLLSLRFGLNGSLQHTLEETGKYFNIGKERTRQLENRCLRRLRKECNIEKMVMK